MKVIIVGCGKLGSGIAKSLVRKGEDVSVIDSDPESFKLLGEDFKGTTITGLGFDRNILERTGIDRADAIISCTKSDEQNALIGRLARNVYRVPRVISRLYDPRRAEIYRSFGIQTISTTTWGVQRTMEMLSYEHLDAVYSVGDGQVQIVRAETPMLLVGRTVKELSVPGEIQVISITRDNKSFIPTLGTSLQRGDIIHISVLSPSAGKLKSLLGL